MPLPRHRRARLLRLFGDFALRWFEMTLRDFDSPDYEGAGVFIAVLQSNIRTVGRDAALNRTYGQDPPPDELRTPVSLREAARALGVPRERFRRRALLLVKAGAFAIHDEGYIVPARTIRQETARRNHRDVGIFHRRLQSAGFAVADIPFTDRPDVWRQGILRVIGDLFLAWIRLAAEPHGGAIVLAAVFAAVVQANDFPAAEGAETPPRPIPVGSLAGSLGLPRESVRRYVAELEATGWLTRTDEGVIVNAALLDSEAIAYVEPLLELAIELFAVLASQGATFSNDPAA